MFATRLIRNEAMSLLAADTGTLAPAITANKMRLAMADFAPAESLTIADLVEAVFSGYAAIDVTVGAQPEGFDPTTDASVIDISPPAGGFRWATTGPISPSVTIYGYYLTDNGGARLFASQRFNTPVVLTLSGQVVDLGDARISLQPNTLL